MSDSSRALAYLDSIINGFALPLKEEHKQFLERTLIPLHKTRYLSLYFRQLNYCVVQFIEKDPSLASTTITGLLRIWPKTNSGKEVMLLNEIEEILDVTPPDEFGRICSLLFAQLTACINSNHFQVAERALLLWNNEYIVGLIGQHVRQILPLVLPVLSRHSKAHWNRNVQILVLNALESFMEMDGQFFDLCVADLALEQQQQMEKRKRHWELWRALEQLALQNCQTPEQRQQVQQEHKNQQTALLYATHAASESASSLYDDDETDDIPPSASLAKTGPAVTQKTGKAATDSTALRRKSVLPVDAVLFHELSGYSVSRSPSPTPGEENEHEMDTS